MKRFLSFLLITVMLLSTVACSGQEAPVDQAEDGVPAENNGDTLVVWTFTEEIKGMIENHYLQDNPDLPYDVQIVVVPNENYQSKLDPALASGKSAPDVFALEAAYIKKYTNSPYTKPLTDLGFEDQSEHTLDYVMDVARDENSVLKGLSWQATPGAYFYRRSMAEELLGTSEPEEVQALVSDFDKFYDVAKRINQESGGQVSAIGSMGDLTQVFFAAREKGWVEDDKLIIDPKIDELMEMAKRFEQEGLSAQANQWEELWFAGMSGDSVFGYFLPTWGLHYVLKPNATNANTGESTEGDWAMIQGPSPYFWGGTWLAVREGTEMEQAAADLVEYMTLNEAFLEEWALETGDVLSNVTVVDKIKDTYAEPFLDGQNHYAAFVRMAEDVDATIITGYDQDIQVLLEEQLIAYSKGEKDKETAMADFKSAVKNYYPDLEVE